MDSLRLIHPTSRHTLTYLLGGLRPEAKSTYSWVSYLIYKKLGMLPSHNSMWYRFILRIERNVVVKPHIIKVKGKRVTSFGLNQRHPVRFLRTI
ncbi:MAG: hypothetical protein SCABRO_02913, partial [Candidatus Scalindua brodae]